MTGRETRNAGPSISFDLTTRVAIGNRLVIVLHLFREGIAILTRPIDTVDQRDVGYVLAKCRDTLVLRGFSPFEDEGLVPIPVRRRAGGR